MKKNISLASRWIPHNLAGQSKGVSYDYIPGLHDANTPVTLAMWVWFDDIIGNAEQHLFYADQLVNNTDDAGVRLYKATAAGEDLMFDCKASVTNPFYRTGETLDVTLGDNAAWHHIAARWNGVINGGDAPDIFINGVQHTSGTSTDGDGTRLATGGSHSFGGRESTQERGANSKLAGAGRWKAWLTDLEIKALADGTHPLDVRPDDLVLCPNFGGDLSNLAERYRAPATFVEAGAVSEAPPKLQKPKVSRSRFVLADAPEDHHLIYNEGLYQGVHGYTVDFRKMAPGKQWVSGSADTYKTHGVLATGDNHTFTVRQSAYGPALTVDSDTTPVPQLFLSPSYFGSFGSHQFSEAEIFITGGVVTDAWCGVSVFNGGDRADTTSSINYMYAILTTNVGTGGTATYRLYKFTGTWSFVNATTEVDPALQPVRLRIEARDQGDATVVDWWVNGDQKAQWVDSTTTRITSKSSVMPHTAPGIAYGHNGSLDQSRFIYWFRGGALPESKHAPDFTVPVNKDLPELGTFEKPWDGQPR